MPPMHEYPEHEVDSEVDSCIRSMDYFYLTRHNLVHYMSVCMQLGEIMKKDVAADKVALRQKLGMQIKYLGAKRKADAYKQELGDVKAELGDARAELGDAKAKIGELETKVAGLEELLAESCWMEEPDRAGALAVIRDTREELELITSQVSHRRCVVCARHRLCNQSLKNPHAFCFCCADMGFDVQGMRAFLTDGTHLIDGAAEQEADRAVGGYQGITGGRRREDAGGQDDAGAGAAGGSRCG